MLRSNVSAPSGRGSPLMFSAASSRIVTLPFSPTKLGKEMEKSLGKKARLLFSLKLQWFLKKCFLIKCLPLVNFQGPEIVTFNTLAQFYAHLFSWTCSCPHSKKSLIPLHPHFWYLYCVCISKYIFITTLFLIPMTVWSILLENPQEMFIGTIFPVFLHDSKGFV